MGLQHTFHAGTQESKWKRPGPRYSSAEAAGMAVLRGAGVS